MRPGREPPRLVAPSDPSRGRVPPHDLAAEAAVLAATILSQEAADEAEATGLSEGHFYSEANRLIWIASQAIRGRGQPVDVVTLAQALRAEGRLEAVGGPAYLAEIIDGTPAVVHVSGHARLVIDRARLRHLIATCQMIAAEGYADPSDAGAFLQDAEGRVFAACEASAPRDSVRDLRSAVRSEFDALTERYRRTSGPPGLSTGFPAIDWRIGVGLQPGNLCYLAARPGMGKTSLALDIARSVAGRGIGVVYVSPEMSTAELTRRLLGQVSGVDTTAIASGRLRPAEWESVAAAVPLLDRYPIVLDDAGRATVATIRATTRRAAATLRARGTPLGLVIVDHLHKLQTDRPHGNREGELEALSGGLKEIAKDLSLPVLALCQLSRAARDRGDPRPVLTDLRGSGAIEQDADQVLMLHRADYYAPDDPPSGDAEVLVAKARDGRTGRAPLRFSAACCRFDSVADEDEIPEDRRWWDN